MEDVNVGKVVAVFFILLIGFSLLAAIFYPRGEKSKSQSESEKRGDVCVSMDDLFGWYPNESSSSVDLQIRNFFMKHYLEACEKDVFLRINTGKTMFRRAWFQMFCKKVVELSGHDRATVANRIVFYTDRYDKKSDVLDFNAHMKDPSHPVPF